MKTEEEVKKELEKSEKYKDQYDEMLETGRKTRYEFSFYLDGKIKTLKWVLGILSIIVILVMVLK